MFEKAHIQTVILKHETPAPFEHRKHLPIC
jgi:hypothetical protein